MFQYKPTEEIEAFLISTMDSVDPKIKAHRYEAMDELIARQMKAAAREFGVV